MRSCLGLAVGRTGGSVEADEAAAERASAGRHLPRDDEGRRANENLPSRRRVPPLSAPPRSGRRAAGVADARVLPDAEPLPPGGRDRAVSPLGGRAAPERRLRASVQPEAPALGPPLRRASPPGWWRTTPTSS